MVIYYATKITKVWPYRQAIATNLVVNLDGEKVRKDLIELNPDFRKDLDGNHITVMLKEGAYITLSDGHAYVGTSVDETPW